MNRLFVLRDETHANSLWQFLKLNWRSMSEQGRPLAVSVSEYKSKRSRDQNSRYWCILQRISENAWIGGRQYSAEVWHEQMKRQLIGCEELPNGETIGMSSAALNVSQFADYMTKVEIYAVSELGIELL